MTGTTNLDSGTLSLACKQCPRQRHLNLAGGTLQATIPVNLNNPVTMTNSAVTIGGMCHYLVGYGESRRRNNTVSVTNTGGTLITGVVQDAATNPAHVLTLTTAGAGSNLTLTGANTFTGLATITGGVVTIESNTALGQGASNAVAGNAASGTTAPVVLNTPSGAAQSGPRATLQLLARHHRGQADHPRRRDVGESVLGTNVLSCAPLISLNTSSTDPG